eukprot:Clim_evm80s225 gene=Clim_evmTU80s225
MCDDAEDLVDALQATTVDGVDSAVSTQCATPGILPLFRKKAGSYKEGPGSTISQNALRRDHLERLQARRAALLESRRAQSYDKSCTEQHAVSELPVESDRRTKGHWNNPWAYQIMLSDWLVEVPDDFETAWDAYMCPVGKRCLVRAGGGHTSAYTRHGRNIMHFQSKLPGGLSRQKRTPRDYVLLDCVWDEERRTFYVLDVMVWKELDFYDSDRSFRCFWISSKIKELNLTERVKQDQCCFLPLHSFACTSRGLQELLSAQFEYGRDGILFYHHDCDYTPNIRNPLTAFLEPKMCEKVLGISDDAVAEAKRDERANNLRS